MAEKKKKQVKVRDLKPSKDAKGGAIRSAQRNLDGAKENRVFSGAGTGKQLT